MLLRCNNIHCPLMISQAWVDSTDNSVGKYNLTWITEGGSPEDLLHYALPHHQVPCCSRGRSIHSQIADSLLQS